MGYTWQYYDLVLLGIACSVTAGVVVGMVTAVATTTSVTVFCLLAAALIGHGLFVNGPIDGPEDLTEPVDLSN